MPPHVSSSKEDSSQAISVKEFIQDKQDQSSSQKIKSAKTISVILVAILLGIGTGRFLLSKNKAATSTSTSGVIKSTNEVGIKDDKTFRDCAQGVLEVNDSSDKKTEGSHKLIREGGPSQTLYMTSSVISLDGYIGKKVEVCGETLKSKRVSWLMGVGKLKLLE